MSQKISDLFWGLSLVALGLIVLEWGLTRFPRLEVELRSVHRLLILGLWGLGSIQVYLQREAHTSRRQQLAGWLEWGALCLAAISMGLSALHGRFAQVEVLFSNTVVLLLAGLGASRRSLRLYRLRLNPALLFALSFLLLILAGTGLLRLPPATTAGISWSDAFFTATSAVSVTGLAVVDTGTAFTRFGQTVILLLIQFGGLGVMTFVSYFGYFFQGGSDLANQLLIKDFVQTRRLGDVFRMLFRIIVFSLGVEAAGAVLIFLQLSPEQIGPWGDRLFFSVFHAVSAFCNAGFSTLSGSLYTEGFRFAYGLHMTLAGLFVVGGLGFAIIFNFAQYGRWGLSYLWDRLWQQRRVAFRPWVVQFGTRLVLLTTGLLILGSTLFLLVSEWNHTLAAHPSWGGKLSSVLFTALTPRTAGFNAVDMAGLSRATLMLYFFLMWVGASPGSTGGGIKTTTLAVALLNARSILRGQERIEWGGRQISNRSVRRAFAVMLLSLFVIGLGTSVLAVLEASHHAFIDLLFETVSAYSTVGLSLGVTGSLTTGGKLMLCLVMFTGRVSALTLLIGLVRQRPQSHSYRYPQEEILIN
ncbi:MAG: ATPase [Bacteroidetes bacterium]|nr:MAG: ATPase [Bacteroidota bacterium]